MSMVSDGGGQIAVTDGRERASAVAAALRRAARKSRLPVTFVSGGGGFRARKGDRLFWRALVVSFILLVFLPVIGVSLYYGLIASKQYETETRFALKSGESSAMDSLSGLAGLAASQQNLDSQIIANFILSRAMIEKIDAALDIRRIYSRDDVDWVSTFNPERPIEDLEKYWKKRVDVSIDTQSSIISVSVRAFTPQDSLDVSKKIIEFSEQLVNDLTERSRNDALGNAKAELDRAEAKLVDATTAMKDVRNAEGVIDAGATAKATDAIVNQLQLQLARLQQQYAVSSRSITADTPQMKILNVQIESLKSKIVSFQNQLADPNPGSGRTLADRMSNLSRQQIELNIAQQQYASAAVGFESARVDVETKHAYLMSFLRPTLAQKALYPRRWRDWSFIVFPSFLLWVILAGLAALVRDNMAG